MYFSNLILIQIEHANALAHSDWPQERRLGLILLDNLFELSLRRKVESLFWSDRTSWHENRKVSSKERAKTLAYYPNLLSFSEKKGLISAEERVQFQFIHEVRNEIYHNSYIRNNDLVEIGLLIACEMIRGDPARWFKSGFRSWANSPGYQNRYFSEENKLFQSDKEIPAVVRKLLKYGLRSKKKAARLLENTLVNEVQSIRRNLKELKEAVAEIDFNTIFSSHLTISNVNITDLTKAPVQIQLELVLLFYECVVELEEQLLDVPNRDKRCEKFAEVLKRKMKTRPKYPFGLVRRFNRKSLKFSAVPISKAIHHTQAVLGSLSLLSRASDKASGAFSDWVQHQVDIARGK